MTTLIEGTDDDANNENEQKGTKNHAELTPKLQKDVVGISAVQDGAVAHHTKTKKKIFSNGVPCFCIKIFTAWGLRDIALKEKIKDTGAEADLLKGVGEPQNCGLENVGKQEQDQAYTQNS